ncbi:MAG: hypothetical protein RL190_1176 [Actinomycetota bacterium]|jgi:hypothetical protein
MADEPQSEPAPAAGAEMPQELDLAQIRVEGLILQVASELMSIGAGQLGMIPGMVNGGDAVQASLAISGADALIETLAAAFPEGAPLPPQVEELRRALADLKLAFAEAVRLSDEAAGAEGAPAPEAAGDAPPAAEPPPAAPPRADVPRPKIWTPGGEV